jgi:uncharacterized membrane protein
VVCPPAHSGPHQSQRRRVVECSAVGLVVGGAVALVAPWQLAVLAGWVVAATLVLARVWFRIRHCDAIETRVLATFEDDSRASFELLLVGSSVVSLAGVAFGLVESHRSDTTLEVLLTLACVLTVALSWAVIHMVFALRYAHDYYTPPEGGIDFKIPGYQPDYQDFVYVAFTVGMTFQVSDTDMNNRGIRRTVLRHALLAYLFSAIIVALMVNVIATLLNR